MGELGNSTQDIANTPTEVVIPDNEKFIHIACGNTFSMGISLPLYPSSSSSSSSSFFYIFLLL